MNTTVEYFDPKCLDYYKTEPFQNAELVFKRKWTEKQRARKGYTKSLGKDRANKKKLFNQNNTKSK